MIKCVKDKAHGTGQALMEFAFCMIVVLLMMYGTMMVFRWAGLDLAERRMAHDRMLTIDVNEDYGGSGGGPPPETGPLKQLDSYFYKPIGMNAVWKGN